MITEIRMDGVASFKAPSTLQTDKKINLIYGLNGTGKTTLSNYLYHPKDLEFSACKASPDHKIPVIVYNQSFVRDHFHVSDGLKGIFSLSRENKIAEEKIAAAQIAIANLESSLNIARKSKDELLETRASEKQKAVDQVWNIKTTYSGGDRVLEYCLEGLKGQKEKLFDHLRSVTKPTTEPHFTTQDLKNEVGALSGEAAQPQEELPRLEFTASDVESDPIHAEPIVGASDSEIGSLIEQLGNSDWVRQGLKYIPEELGDTPKPCPFCQEKTITAHLAESISQYFNARYQARIAHLQGLEARYLEAIDGLATVEMYANHQFANKAVDLRAKYDACMASVVENRRALSEKLSNPGELYPLAQTADLFADFNDTVVAPINKAAREFNAKLQSRDASLETLKNKFWGLMRWEYDQTISRYESDVEASAVKLEEALHVIAGLEHEIEKQRLRIVEAQKATVNLDSAVDAINVNLRNLGIEDFSITKHSDTRYRIVRPGAAENAFPTLSEGEKAIISFLYFCEMYKGRTSVAETASTRIVVIDDPISSLSHMYVFNVGQIIKRLFFMSERCTQVFVLTHSLYFFYELTETNHERRKNTQRLFRMVKSAYGSEIRDMKYEEIQNDYHSYWAVVNNPDQPPALIANCMRNIIEYFFGFVGRKDVNNVFQMPELQEPRFQAFCRYVNRESHSLSQNIIDMKEFDYEAFKDGMRLIFEATNYGDHYLKMSKI